MMRIRLLVLAVCCLTTAGCPLPPPKKEKKKEPVRGKARPRADGAAAVKPATVPPKGGPPEEAEVKYDPAKDPANAGGFDLTKKRSPEDPADRRKKPFSIEALYRIKSVGGPQYSPDGKKILFTVTRYDLKAGKSNADVYLMNADGSSLKRMTRHEASDSQPRWMADSRTFVFVSTRSKKPQIWRMPIDGGEPEKLTDVSTGVSTLRVSPDGKNIAFVSRVFPEHGADDAKNKALLEDINKSPIKAHMADELLFRHWTFYKDGRRSHILAYNVETKKITDLTPGDFDSPAFSLGGNGIAWSPKSDEICFASNREPGSARAWTTNKDLWVVPAKGGKAVNLTAANKAFDGHPAYSPDGRYIAFLRQKTPVFEADRFRLALYDRKTGKVRVLTEPFDNWVIDFRWSKDGRTLIFQAAVKGRYPLFRLELEKGTISKLGIPSARAFDLSPKGEVAFTFSRVGTPRELYATDSGVKKVRRLTHFNKPVVDAFDIRPAEEMWLKGADEKPVHVFIVKPHGFRPHRKYPLVINVHGGPQGQWQDSLRGDWQAYPGAGYVVAFFNPHGSIGYGQAYTSAISKDWGGKVYRDVMKVTDALEKLPYVDKNRVGAMGWSYGGYMMAWLLGHTQRFKAIAAMMALYDLNSFYGGTEELWFPEWDLGGTPWTALASYRKWSPSTYVKNFKTPTLIISGERDYRVPYTQSLQLFTALRRQNVPARLIIFPNDGHWPSWVKSMPLYYAAHLDWFHRYLKGKKSPYDLRKMVQGRAFAAEKKR